MPLCQIGHGAHLAGANEAVRNPDPHHEVRHGFALAALTPHGAHPVTLRVHTPRPEIRAQPFGRNGLVPVAGKAPDLFQALPRVLLALEALRALGFCFLLGC